MASIDIQYASDRQRLESLLQSVDRPGSYCTHGRVFVPMPSVRVEGVGMLSFPVPDNQIRALVEASEPAPYGKGTATLVDTSVRHCRQIGAERIRLGGGTWADTLSGILDKVAAGLGCPSERLDAHLYKMLVYESGGFFSEHRDTEKADGMIATLSITLPAAGGGGDLVVRHGGREVRIDMNATEPSELAFAAFYADCAHEVRPVRDGYRLSLVFNLCVRPGDKQTPRTAPDYRDRVGEVAEELGAWADGDDGPDKLVWLLEHDYTEAGLSFDAMKNIDGTRASVLSAAADQTGCELYAAILHIEEAGTVRYDFDFYDYRESYPSDDQAEMEEVLDGLYWLDHWVAPTGTRPPLGKISLSDGETLPRGALEQVEPDEQWVQEATGNAAATVERAYRRAALVLWPRSRSLNVLAGEGIAGAVAWVAQQVDRNASPASDLLPRVIEIWPGIQRHRRDDGGRAEMLGLLGRVGDAALALRFLREVVLTRYDGTENENLPAVLGVVGPGGAAGFLADLVSSRFSIRPGATVALLLSVGELEGFGWREPLRGTVRAALAALPDSLAAQRKTRVPAWPPPESRKKVDTGAVSDLFILASSCGLAAEAEAAAAIVIDHPDSVSPERDLPAALGRLSREAGLVESAAYRMLWHHAAESLLTRSHEPPEGPRDWTIASDVRCDCEHCEALKAFCRDPVTQARRFPLRKDLRAHLHRQIDHHRLDMSHVTERRGRPYTLVCTKNRASHRRRLEEYATDVECMATLLALAPADEGENGVAALSRRLRAALSAAG